MPDVGEGLTEAEIVTWNVAVGDTVVVNQIMCEIETAKAAVELPSPFAGIVGALLAQPGDTVAVGRPIVAIETAEPGGGGPSPAASPARTAPAGAGSEEGGAKIGEAGVDGRIATLVGYGPRPGSVTRRPRRTVTAAPAPTSPQQGSRVDPSQRVRDPVAAGVPCFDRAAGPCSTQSQRGSLASTQSQRGSLAPTQSQQGPLPPTRAGVGATSAAPPVAPPRPSGTVPLAKPPVRKLAKDLGVDLREVIPSRADGVITREDVQAHANGTATGHGPAAVEHAPVAASVAVERREPIRGVRRATAAAMVASAFTAPHVTEFLAVDVTETMALRDRLRATREYAEVRLTPLAFVAKAVCLAARRTPEVNAHWDEAAGEIVYYDHVQLGIAAATPRGLIVPKIRNADTLSLGELAAALGELTATAREGKTPPADLIGGTFTITNVGVFGVDTGTPILNPGEAAILAVGSIKQAPWVVDGALAVRTVCQLALSFDHRLVDGEQGSRFLADVGRLLEDPGLALTF